MKNIILTGEFKTEASILSDLIKKSGYSIAKDLDDNIDVLLVGDGSKSYWASSPTGILIHEATRLAMNGSQVEILYETEFIDQLKDQTSSMANFLPKT